MKTLIIGGSGLLSSAVAKEALREKQEVYVLNRGKHPEMIPIGSILLKADIHDDSGVKEQLDGKIFDCVIDFISRRKDELEKTINLVKDKTSQIVFISTTCIYNTHIPGEKTEDSPKVFEDWSYSKEKWECEEFLSSYSARNQLNYTIVRPCVTYDNSRIPYGVMPQNGYHWTWIARILNHKPIIVWDGGEARWNLTRVEDFARGVVGLIGNAKAYGRAFNVCGEKSYSWIEVINSVEKLLGEKAILFDIPSYEYAKAFKTRAPEILCRAFDNACSNAALKEANPDFKQHYSLEEGVRLTLEAYQENQQKGIDYYFDGIQDGIIYRALKEKHKKADYKLHFIDYLGNAGEKERRDYMKGFYYNTLRENIKSILYKVIRRIVH